MPAPTPQQRRAAKRRDAHAWKRNERKVQPTRAGASLELRGQVPPSAPETKSQGDEYAVKHSRDY